MKLYQPSAGALFLLFIVSLTFAQPKIESVNYITEQGGITDKLSIDFSTVQDAIALLGNPTKDEFGDFEINEKKKFVRYGIKGMLETDKAQKAYRKLTFKKIDGYEKIVLRFYKDKLVQIILDYDPAIKSKRILAENLPEKYATGFVVFEGATKETKLTDFEDQKQPSIPRVYNVIYLLFGVKFDRFFLVTVDNNKPKAFWNSLIGKPTGDYFPGFVIEIQIISRRLEKK